VVRKALIFAQGFLAFRRRGPIRLFGGGDRRTGMGLASNSNVYNTCLRILRSRGFALEVRGEAEPDGSYPIQCQWIARKGDFYFCGHNPIELLGLVAVFDHVKPKEDRSYWWAVEGPDVWSELMEAAFPDKAIDSAPDATPDPGGM
jgi:hypothetical protein